MLWLNEVGSWLAHSAIFGAMLLLLGGLAVLLCREPVYRIRIIHWTFVACLLVPMLQYVDLTPSYSLGVWEAVVPRDASSRVAVDKSNADPIIPKQRYHTPVEAEAGLAEPAPPESRHEVAAPHEVVLPAQAATPAPSFTLLFIATRVVQLVYLALVCYLLCAGIASFVRRSIIARNAKPADASLRDVLTSIAGSRGKHARLLVSDRIDSPLMWGLLRPTIVMPAKLAATRNSAQLRWGLAHEWSHVDRRDYSSLVVAGLAKFACFYQPAYWWLRRQLSLSQDYLADAFAAKHGESAEDYAGFLVSLARARYQRQLAGTLGIGDRGSNLFRRIHMLVRSTRPLLQRDKRAPALVITLTALLAVGGLSAVRLSAEPPDDQPAAKPTEKESGESKPEPNETETNAGELPDPITYSGKVVDRHTGEPIAGATVEVTHELSRDPETGEWITLRTTTHKSDDKGEYRFTLPPEEVAESSLYLVVDAHHPDYQSKGGSGYSHAMIRKNLANGEPPFYSTIKLSSGEAIAATVLRPDGTPAANLRVLAYSKPPSKDPGRSFELGAFQHAQTDEHGRFRIVVATPGDGVLWVFPTDASPLARRIGDGRGDLGPLQLQEGTRLSGQVLDAKGAPVANVAVNLSRDGDGEEADEFLNSNAVANHIGTGAVTDEEGRFQLKPLPPGKYRAEVRESVHDPSVRETRRREEIDLEHVFTPLEVTIREGEPHAPIEIRAVPHVVVRGRFFDSAGRPRASHQQHLFARLDGQSIFARSTRPGDDGWFEFKVPHGAEQAQLSLTTNEHSALRWRTKPDEPLQCGRQIELGALEEDFTTLEVIRYTAPLLLLKAVDEKGEQLRDFKPSSKYTTRPNDERSGTFISGALGDIGFESQPDGRWRSRQMRPDEDVTITLEKEGYTCEPQVVSLKEAEERELVFVLKTAE